MIQVFEQQSGDHFLCGLPVKKAWLALSQRTVTVISLVKLNRSPTPR